MRSSWRDYLRNHNRGRGVVCTNPAALGGGSGRLDPSFATAPLAGPLGAVSDAPPASVSTRWVSVPGLYRARCRRGNGAVWLGVTPLAAIRVRS